MKSPNETCDPTVDGFSERQVLLYPADWEEPSPGNMEDIKISIVNDRAAGLKRPRDEVLPITPCSKRLRSALVSCSTPSTASAPLCSSLSTSESDSAGQRQCNVSTPSHSLEQNLEPGNELDDSLLEPLVNESDSPLRLSVDEIESLLEDGASCVVEPPGLEDKSRYGVSPKSECQKVSISSPDHLAKSSTLTEETARKEDPHNYAAMAPSPRHSPEHTLVKWSEDAELPFDCDNLLATSPEQGNAAEPDVPCMKQIRSMVSDPATSQKDSTAVNIKQTIHAASSDIKDVVQQHPPITPNHSKPQLIPDHSEVGHNVKSITTMSAVDETKLYVNPCANPESQRPQKIAASGSGIQTCSSTSLSGRPPLAVTPLPRPSPRPFISTFELEANKDIYCDHVSMHIEGPEGASNLEDPLQELALLLNQVSRANQSWQHPSNFSKRNHPRYGKKPAKRCTLKQWVAKNGGAVQRFKDLASTFKRSPVPDVLPSSSS